MSYYDDLDIPPTATDADIKRAYRKKANETHPDKGGNASEFAKVAHAYEVLRDPERRQLYDATGKDNRDPIEVVVQNELLKAFAQVLAADTDVEIVKSVRTGFEMALTSIAENEKKVKARKKKLTTKRGKVKTTNAVNIVHMLIDKELAAIDAYLENLKYETKVVKECLKALKTYSEEFKAPEPSLEDLLRRDIYFSGVRINYGR